MSQMVEIEVLLKVVNLQIRNLLWVNRVIFALAIALNIFATLIGQIAKCPKPQADYFLIEGV